MPSSGCPVPSSGCPIHNSGCPVPNSGCPVPSSGCPVPGSGWPTHSELRGIARGTHLEIPRPIFCQSIFLILLFLTHRSLACILQLQDLCFYGSPVWESARLCACTCFSCFFFSSFSFVWSYSGLILFHLILLFRWLFSNEREKKNRSGFGWKWTWEDLEGVEGGGTTIKIYCMKKICFQQKKRICIENIFSLHLLFSSLLNF